METFLTLVFADNQTITRHNNGIYPVPLNGTGRDKTTILSRPVLIPSKKDTVLSRPVPLSQHRIPYSKQQIKGSLFYTSFIIGSPLDNGKRQDYPIGNGTEQDKISCWIFLVPSRPVDTAKALETFSTKSDY